MDVVVQAEALKVGGTLPRDLDKKKTLGDAPGVDGK